jgi:hypothetical protein
VVRALPRNWLGDSIRASPEWHRGDTSGVVRAAVLHTAQTVPIPRGSDQDFGICGGRNERIWSHRSAKNSLPSR